MVQGKVFLKGGGWHSSCLFFSRFIIFTLSLAKLCYVFEEKLFFSATIIFGQKFILSCLNLVYLNQGRLVGWIRAGGGYVRVGEGRNCLKYLKRGWNRKEG